MHFCSTIFHVFRLCHRNRKWNSQMNNPFASHALVAVLFCYLCHKGKPTPRLSYSGQDIWFTALKYNMQHNGQWSGTWTIHWVNHKRNFSLVGQCICLISGDKWMKEKNPNNSQHWKRKINRLNGSIHMIAPFCPAIVGMGCTWHAFYTIQHLPQVQFKEKQLRCLKWIVFSGKNFFSNNENFIRKPKQVQKKTTKKEDDLCTKALYPRAKTTLQRCKFS